MNWSARLQCIESIFKEHFNWNDSNGRLDWKLIKDLLHNTELKSTISIIQYILAIF
jgi:hypothetical protein